MIIIDLVSMRHQEPQEQIEQARLERVAVSWHSSRLHTIWKSFAILAKRILRLASPERSTVGKGSSRPVSYQEKL